jgi:hypothetical protein
MSYNEEFKSRVDKYIRFLVGLSNKGVFVERVKDLIVILRRGY